MPSNRKHRGGRKDKGIDLKFSLENNSLSSRDVVCSGPVFSSDNLSEIHTVPVRVVDEIWKAHPPDQVDEGMGQGESSGLLFFFFFSEELCFGTAGVEGFQGSHS